jgi:hypothetical protein
VDELRAATKAFWLDHVVSGVMPAADAHAATGAAIGEAWGGQATVKVPTVDLTDLRPTVAELSDFRAQRTALRELIDERENLVKAAIGAAGDGGLSDAVIDGELAASWRSQRAPDSGVDVAAVRAEHGDRYDRPAKPPVRVLRLHGRYLR